jgi:dCMP deaminase
MRPSWDEYFMKVAETAHIRSEDNSTHVGCVIAGPDHEIRSTGYNDFPRKVRRMSGRNERPTKYLFTCHAEENTVAHAARFGVSLLGCTAYVTHHPCATCTRLLIQAGVNRIVTKQPDREFLERWALELGASKAMLKDAGVTLEIIND